MTEKKPEAGEFWECNERVKIVGTLSDGATVGETSSGSIRTFKHENGWRHLPECDSFEWQPETFPQYWTSESVLLAFMKQISKEDFVPVFVDGSEGAVRSNSTVDRTRLTQKEAEARIKKTESHVEETQKREYVRLFCDSDLWLYPSSTVPSGAKKELKHDETGFYLAEVKK